MSRRYWIAALVTATAVFAGISLSQFRRPGNAGEVNVLQGTEFLIKLGIGDKAPTAWDGTISLASGTLLKVEGWRLGAKDTVSGTSWKASTRTSTGGSGNPGPILENGLLVTAAVSDSSAVFSVQTAQGSFSFTPQAVSGSTAKTYLSGRASVEIVPASTQLTDSFEEQDFPAVAQNGDDVWVSYVEFAHSNRSQESFAQMKTEPRNLDYLARAAGGDQVFLLHYSKSRRVWDAPVPVSAARQDIMRTAVAVDGQKRVWVFWSANQGGNFDIYAKCYDQRSWKGEWSLRLTTDAGPDLNPVAATDSAGRVWVAWQGYRNGNLEILARVQNGPDFLEESAVSFSPASDWDPAIAAGPSGEIAISWDTYDKGDYDVYFRRLRFNSGIQMDPPVAVAASTNFEARSSLAYDPQNRLWVAYEASDTRWGKDFGAYETTGIALYQGHTIKLKCFQGAEAYSTVNNVAGVLPAPKNIGKQPNPTIAENRKPNGGAGAPAGPKNSFPRLAIDPDGKVYLAFRITTGGRMGVGTIWAERVVYFDGAAWSAPVTIVQSDGLLDARPALTALEGGDLLIVSASDHRQSPVAVNGTHDAGGVQYDLFATELRVSRTQQTTRLVRLSPELVAPPENDAQPELDQITMMRNSRLSVGGQNMQLMRGEFHRHTEISGDGGGDGPVIDAYRYFIDTANMDWAACCDHDNGGGREYSWWIEQKLTDAYTMAGRYTGMFGYERSVGYPEGHRNALFARRGVRPLPRLSHAQPDSVPTPAPDTQMLYHYLKQFGGLTASHTSGTDMGTDWRDNDPILEPVVEIYQGDRQNYEMPGAPRSNSAGDSIGGWRALGFVSLALQKGYRLGFQASSDHISTHMSYCNVWVTSPTRAGILEGLSKRHVYGSTENILADVRAGEHLMGDEFTVNDPPTISVKLQGTANFSKVHIIKDNNYVYSITPGSAAVDFTWRDGSAVRGKTSYYYVRGEQEDGELVWVSPMWITYQ